jgi:TonB-dependent SusC/RagA subfamily outer membrane receptor
MFLPRLQQTHRRGPIGRAGLAIGLALAAVATVASDAVAQNTGTLTGRVLNVSSQQPVAGAQVTVVGTSLGALTNNIGRYAIPNVPAGQHTVRVEYIGYGAEEQPVTVQAGGSVALDFEIREQAIALEAVVVTGTAGQARRREVGNSISQVNARDIQLATVTDLGDVLQGRAAGVQVNDFSGQVGTASQIRLRGNNSLTQGNDPLIYVDGVRIEVSPIMGDDDEVGASPNVLDMLNPSDIERIEIIKGPAATTLYGTEASGGVIQVFTKRGTSGAPAWAFAIDQGVSSMGHIGGPLNPESINPTGLNLNDCTHEPGCPGSGSWFRNGHLQRYDLSVRGGGETASYFVSGRWGREQGVIDPQGAESYSLRANISFQPFDGLDIRLSNHYAHRNIRWIPDGNNAGGLLLNVLRGEAGYTPGNNDSFILNNDIRSDIDNFVNSVSVNWSPNSTWAHRLNVGMDYTIADFTDFKPWGDPESGGAFDAPEGDREDDQDQDRNLTLDYSGSLNWSPFGSISSRFSWGGQLYEEYNYGLNGFDNTFAGPGDQLIGDGTIKDANESRSRVQSGGFFLQEVLGWQDRLFLTGGMRWDGFSTFGSGFGLAAYPKLSAAYLISEESFWPSNLVETLKLRAAWGESGKAPGTFDADRIWEAGAADEAVPAVVIANLGNPDLGPERTGELELGFDLSAFNGRIFLEFTRYDQTTKDALIGVQEAPSGGTEEATLRNLGEVKNWGTETSLTVVPVRLDNLEWSVGAHYATNDSEITDLGPLQDLGNSRQKGLPLWIQWDDIVQNPTAVGELPVYEKGMIGRLFPTKSLSLSTRLNLWRSLTLDVLGEGQYGMVRPSGPAYQQMRRNFSGGAVLNTWPYCNDIQTRWDADDRASLTALQVAQCIDRYSDQGVWTCKADFFKLRSATLAFQLPDRLVPGTQSATLSVQGKNLFTSTDYCGLDPESQDNGFGDGTPNEYYTTPPPRTLILGLRVNF